MTGDESQSTDGEVYAWLRAHYSDQGFKPQGLLCPYILIPAAATEDEDKYALIQAVIDFVNWAFNEVALIPGEFPVEALSSYFADYYVAQVLNGGHAQFISNSDYGEVTVRLASLGLKAMGAGSYQAINQEMLDFMAAAPEPLKQTLIGDYSPRVAPLLDDLDTRFYLAGKKEEYYAAHRRWLESLPCLRPLGPSDLETELASIRRKNLEQRNRHERARKAQERSEAASPLYRTVKALCRKAGKSYQGLTAGGLLPLSMISPSLSTANVFAWGVRTGLGVGFVFFYERSGWRGRPRAVFYEKENETPLAWRSLSRAEYEEIVHPGWRGEH